jgi:mono/diheme cytochrome c family protein
VDAGRGILREGREMRTILAVFVVGVWASMAFAGAAEWKAPAPAKAVKNPLDQATGLKLGRALFQENCVICHGTAGKGDGEAAAAMNPRPKSLVDKTVQAQTDGELFWKISEGREAMPGWKSISEKERWALVHQIRGLAGKK